MKNEPERISRVVPEHIVYWHDCNPDEYPGGPFTTDPKDFLFVVAGMDEAEQRVAADPFVQEKLLKNIKEALEKMKKLSSIWITVCCFLLFAHTALAENGLTRISPHVYSYIGVQEASPANSFGANAGIIIGKKGIVVVDTLISAKEANRFLQDIRKISDKPILYVIDTHYHLDHSFGNSEFSKLGAAIVAHKYCADEMHLKAADGLANAADFGLTPEEMAGTEIAYPDITFTDRIGLNPGGVEVNLIYIAPSHSKGSILIQVPSEKVVFTGDILFTDFHPYMGDGDIKGWQQALDFLATLEADKIIPGHGPLSSKKDVADMKSYITTFDNKARELTSKPDANLEEIVNEMKKVLPIKTQGEWLIGANIQAKYLKKNLKKKTKKKNDYSIEKP